MSLIYEQDIQDPATHALVIGVGYYAHLPGGEGEEFPEHEDLEQLTSPPESARAFANWLLTTYHNPDKPLATLEMLISADDNAPFELPGGEEKPVEAAKFDQVSAAINRWIDRGDKDKDNLMVFFFCGHGVSRGYATSLLMEDFGKNKRNPLDHALSFREFYNGMDICKARQQCYFIDACRSASPELITRYDNYTGQPVIPGSAEIGKNGFRSAPIYYATVAGSNAYGRTNQPSMFTESLLKALGGAGSNDLEEEGSFRVDTDTLNQGLDHLLRRAASDTRGIGQVISVDELVKFTLHYLREDPVIPVTIGCKPRKANLDARLSYQGPQTAEATQREYEEETDWHLDLEIGDYHFYAEFSGGAYHNNEKDSSVRPPFRKVILEVE
jgi:hypothetical protein